MLPMPMVYVARSQTVQEWGSDVGLTEYLYKVGVTDGTGEAAVDALNAESYGGAADWVLMKATDTDKSESEIVEKLARKEKMVDPTF
jgi:hypothetical protein